MDSIGEGSPILGLALESLPSGLRGVILGLRAVPLPFEDVDMGTGGFIVTLISGSNLMINNLYKN